MTKSNLKSIKILTKAQQKSIVGGMCPGGGYPIYCPGVYPKIKKCPELCP